MEQDQEGDLYVCKVCGKGFSSGRVLGGHMRSHLVSSSRSEEPEFKKGGCTLQSGYGLRECPKKSRKSSSCDNACELCGKEFDSRRALFGHMRHHSYKGKAMNHCRECGKVYRKLKSLTNHMRLHAFENVRVSQQPMLCSNFDLAVKNLAEPKNLCLVRRKRSKRFRCKASASSSSISSLNESSYVAENDEVEEAAMCLMMLSRGVKDWALFELGADDCSCDNSVDFEARPLNRNKRLLSELDGSCGDGRSYKRQRAKLDLGGLGSSQSSMEQKMDEISEFASRSLADAEEKIGSANLVNGALDTADMDPTSVELEPKENLVAETPSGSMDCQHCRQSELSPPAVEIDSNNTDYEFQSKSEYKCRTCDKTFRSYQALGGHQTLHRASRMCSDFGNESFQRSTLPSITSELESKTPILEEGVENVGEHGMQVSPREHKCLICLKVFASGQALGGHKKVHYGRTRQEQQAVERQEGDGICNELDLNFPAAGVEGVAKPPGGVPATGFQVLMAN